MDRPNDGQVKFNVDVGPMGVMGYDVVTPASNYNEGGGGGEGGGEAAYSQRLESNRLLRVLERTLLIGGSIDAEALCVQSGVWVWRLVVDVSLVCDAGNCLDACVLAVVAALRHFRLAQVDVMEDTSSGVAGEESFREMQIIDSDEKEPTPLPLHHTPVTATFALFSDKSGATSTVSSLIDPTDREELAADGIVTWSYNKYGEMCCLDFPGGCELSMVQLMSSSDLGKKRCIDICEILETALMEAESKAHEERMERLKHNSKSLGIVTTISGCDDDDDDAMNIDNEHSDSKAKDEEYRKLALDYASGHIAAAVKDRPLSFGSSKKPEASSLFHAFLHSVKKAQTVDEDMEIDALVSQDEQTAKHHDNVTQQKALDDISKLNAITQQQKATEPKPMVMLGEPNSSDEEENVVQLKSEFCSVDNDNTNNQSSISAAVVADQPQQETAAAPISSEQKQAKQMDAAEGEDVDDLAIAVKKKKSKKSKKKSN